MHKPLVALACTFALAPLAHEARADGPYGKGQSQRADHYYHRIWPVVPFQASGLVYTFRTADGGVACRASHDEGVSRLICSNGRSTLHCVSESCSVTRGAHPFGQRSFRVGWAGTLLQLDERLTCLVMERVIGCRRSDGSTFSFSPMGFVENPEQLTDEMFDPSSQVE